MRLPAGLFGAAGSGADRDAHVTENALYSLLKAVVDLCLLRIGPQQLPRASLLAGIAVAAYILVDLATALAGLPPLRALFASLLDTLLAAAFIQLALQLTHKPERFVQTLTATLLAWSLLGVLVLPLLFGTSGVEQGSSQSLLLFAGLALYLVWSLVVFGHILRHALALPLYGGIGLSIVYFVLSQIVMGIVFPPVN